MTSVILADDHAVARTCLAEQIQAEPRLELVGEAADGANALRLTAQHHPDVLLAAFGLAGVPGVEVTRQARERSAKTRVVLFAAPLREQYIAEAVRSGVAGYVLRSASAKEVVRAVQEVAAGRRYVSPPLSIHGLELILRNYPATSGDPHASLTPREREVLRLAAEGLSNAKIADRLGISRRTAETHRANLLGKLGLENQTELILYALRRGVLPLEWDGASGAPNTRRTT
jgi:DNA-binding NarL/FixJ family response regulator